MLVALCRDRRVEAWTARKGDDHRCPVCGEEVVLRQGRVRVHHFAHRPDATCFWGRGESLAHLAAKAALVHRFRQLGLYADTECCPEGCDPEVVRSDVLVQTSHGLVAIEVQHSPIGLDDLETRSNRYAVAGIALAWIVVRKLPDAEEGMVERYPAKAWEEWIHGFHMGRIWYLDPSDSSLWLGRMANCRIKVPMRLWGESYTKTSKRWKRLTLKGPCPSGTALTVWSRNAVRMGSFNLPAMRVAQFDFMG